MMTRPDPQSDRYQRTDFHIHTNASPDSLTTPHQLLAAARRKGIHRLVICDHNTIAGALKAKALDPQTFIVGEEIMTTRGEILAFFVTEEIPPGLSPKEVIARLKDQDAFISISHPFDPTRKGGWQIGALLEIIPEIDAIETFNARCIWPGYNWRASAFAREHQLLGTHGSDAHTAFEIGRGSLLVPPFDDTASLRVSLRRAVSPRLILSMPWVHFTSRYASWVKVRRQGRG